MIVRLFVAGLSFAGLLCVLLPQGAAGTPQKVSFGVRSKIISGWRGTPRAAQSLEWLRDVDAAGAAGFIRMLAESVKGGNTNDAVALAGDYMQSGSVRTFHELVVQNNYYSPRVELLRTLERADRRRYGQSCTPGTAWALVWSAGGSATAACDGAGLRRALAGEITGEGSAVFSPNDLDILLRRGASGGVVVLYSSLRDEALAGLAALIAEVDGLPAASAWESVFRHADGPKAASGVGHHDLLTGYGVELAIKSSEYKTTADDEDKKDEQEQDGESGDGGEDDADLGPRSGDPELEGELELDGLLFHVLLQRHEGARKGIWAFKEQLEIESNADMVLNAWAIKDIGLQATARIKESENPLLTLMHLSQNFPAHVVGLAKASVPDAISKAAAKMRNSVREGAEVFSMNGRLVRPDHSELSIFPLMQSLKPFFIGIERLVRTGVPEAVACELLTDSSGMQLPERLDWRSPHLPPQSYDVRRDKKAARWGGTLQSLMYAFPGQLAPVKIPLYTAVFAFDPADTAELANAVEVLAMMPMPMAVHLVMCPGAPEEMAAEWDEQALGSRPAWLGAGASGRKGGGGSAVRISQAIAASYAYMLELGSSKARAFLKKLLEHSVGVFPEDVKQWPDDADGLKALEEVWEASLPDEAKEGAPEAWDEIIGSASDPLGAGANATKYVQSLGMPVPSMVLNGKLLLKGAYEGARSLYPHIGSEQQMFQRAVYQGQLRGEDQVAEFLATQGLISSYHQDITPELGQQGGEEGNSPGGGVEVEYVQWPSSSFLDLPFLESSEPPKEDGEDGSQPASTGRLGLFHVTVIRQLGHAYLLTSFASHLLAPDRAALESNKRITVPALQSHWYAAVEASNDFEAPALAELAACVRGVQRLLPAEGEEDPEGVMRRKLMMLKWLGKAVPAAAAGMGANGLSATHAAELCKTAVQKKIDPDYHAAAHKQVELARAEGASASEVAMLAAAGSSTGSLWVCNGRKIVLEAHSQPVAAQLVQTLELMEAQYDVDQVEEEAEEEEEQQGRKPKSAQRTAPLFERLAIGAVAESMPTRTHGLVAGIRAAALASVQAAKFSQPQEFFERAPAAFKVSVPPARPDAAVPIRVYGILDPLSTTAQSASAVLALFGMAFNAEVNLVMNPIKRYSEYPLKRYYREVIRWPETLADGRRAADVASEFGGGFAAGVAEFPGLATKHTLTAAIHPLPTWLVTSYEAEHDMDNLRLVDVGNGKWCETTYVLRSIYVEGQAFIMGSDGWPVGSAKGLQIDAFPKGSEDAVDDALVMGNLGYFQVHGNPGVYEVRPKLGLSNDTFEPANMKDLQIDSFITPPHQVRVKVREGRKADDMFEQFPGGAPRNAGPMGGRASPLARLFGGFANMWGKEEEDAALTTTTTRAPKALAADGDELPTIHIFSVASGHLYEKLLSIMILSVRKTTQCPLHFWFIDQFLSPKFKAFIPHLAREHNFDFDFVTYKWPSWLNPQSEKQRLIWAYKILFLDVLFPLDVRKIIFIDADQVVRADVRELWDTDLQGKVYGWVPMGDTNPDVEGFRFWKQGYWKNHLGDLKYHIAALYVIDLDEFRRTSTGDQLRGVYNQLSRDPNSLSNLEQDLVNFAQHQVPIHSLPDEWLWCETWCEDGKGEAKAKAKTIDLCQNPLTKEPKIVMAKRIISEWQGYHDDVQRLQDKHDFQGSLDVPTGGTANAAGGTIHAAEL